MGVQASAWICTVCGYVHQGSEPPDECPVCGATSDLFDPYEEPAPAGAPAAAQWRCLNCEHIHDGDTAPEVCPVCGAAADRFEPLAPESPASAIGDDDAEIIVVGAGIAGVSAAEAVRRAAPRAHVVLLSRESTLPYYRLNLTRYLAGEIDVDQLPLHPQQWYADNGIDLVLGAELTGVDSEHKTVAIKAADDRHFDKLVLAMGSHPFMPAIPGIHRDNVTPLRTLKDAERILEQAPGSRCVVIGGGVLGLETAGALARRGIEVVLLEGHGWLLPRQLNETAGKLLEEFAKGLGLQVRRNARTKELLGDERVREVLLEDGTTIPADLVIVTTGVRANSYLARMAGLDVGRGVMVNNQLRTSHPDILAAGDIAEHRGVSYGTWGPSQFQGTIAGMNAVGGGSQFAGIPRSNMLKVLGYDMFSIGQITPEDASFATSEELVDGNYRYFVFRDSHLVGAILLGDTSLSAAVKHAVETGLDCSAIAGASAVEVAEFLQKRAAA